MQGFRVVDVFVASRFHIVEEESSVISKYKRSAEVDETGLASKRTDGIPQFDFLIRYHLLYHYLRLGMQPWLSTLES